MIVGYKNILKNFILFSALNKIVRTCILNNLRQIFLFCYFYFSGLGLAFIVLNYHRFMGFYYTPSWMALLGMRVLVHGPWSEARGPRIKGPGTWPFSNP